MLEEYNKESVFYCKHCMSLGILSIGLQPYCKDCGDTEIGETDIYKWQEMYKLRYNEDFINKPIED